MKLDFSTIKMSDKAYPSDFTQDAETVFNGSNEHRWAVCTCVQ